MPAGFRRHLVGKTLINVFHCYITEVRFVGRGVARSKYVGWTDMASAEREPTRGVWRRSRPDRLPYLSPCKKSSDLYQFQERPLANVGWTCPPRGDATVCRKANDHTDIFINQRIECYLNNTINLRPLSPHIMPWYTHKMAIVSWP